MSETDGDSCRQRTFPSRKDNPSLNIRDMRNDLLQLYSLDVPYMIMVETCREGEDAILLQQYTPGNCVSGSITKAYLKGRPSHQHSFIEMMCVLSGRIENHIEDEVFTYSAGQCCMMNRNIQHREVFNGDFQAVFLMLPDDCLNELYSEAALCTGSREQALSQSHIFQMLEDQTEGKKLLDKCYLDCFPLNEEAALARLRACLTSFIRETQSTAPGAHFFSMGSLSRLLSIPDDPEMYTVRAVRSDVTGQQFLFGKLQHLVEASHGRSTRAELSSALNYNGEYLNRVVKKFTGKTLLEYQKGMCLQEVCRRLTDTNSSISAILEDMDITNRSHFYREFQEAYGITPKEYRARAHRQMEKDRADR